MADLLRKTKSLYASTANTFGTGTSVTITPSSVSGLPTDTEITLTFDRVDSTGAATPTKMERIIGTISGGNFVVRTSPSSGRGADGTSDAAHTSPVVEYIPNAKDVNDMIDCILAQHTQAGVHTNITASSINLLQSTSNIKVLTADPYRTIVIPAAAFSPTTTAGCADVATVETTTNKINYKVLDFDKATEEHAFANFVMPISYDGGTLLVSFEWTSTAATGDVVWGIEGRAFANDDAADQAVGTAQTVTDTITAAADFDFTAETSALTLAGSPAGGQSVYLQVFRKAADGADTLDADARLKSVSIRYKVGQYSD